MLNTRFLDSLKSHLRPLKFIPKFIWQWVIWADLCVGPAGKEI